MMNKKIYLCFFIFVFIFPAAIADIAVITPMATEAVYIRQHIEDGKILTIHNIHYYVGKIGNEKIITIISGMGKTNAAAITARLIRDFHPSLVILSGVAGGVDPALKIGDVIVGKQVVDIDYAKYTKKAWSFDYPEFEFNPQNNKPFPALYSLTNSLLIIVNNIIKNHSNYDIELGNIATTDVMQSPAKQIALMTKAKMSVVENEGSAIAHTAWLYDIPCIIVRSVCNKVGQPVTNANIQYAANHAGEVTVELIKAL